MRILCWNCRGIGDPATVKELRDLVEACAPAVLCIVETQLAKYRVEGLAGSLGFVGRFGVDSRGRSGGLCLFWRNNVDFEIKTYSQYHIDSVVNEPGKEAWRLSVFYGAVNRSMRYKTWDTMKILRGENDLPWVCMGDFNEILRQEEQMGPNERDSAQIEGFREVVDVCELADLGYKGLDWTLEKRVAGEGSTAEFDLIVP
ncbi:uncharacterized protein [Aegilops tauschii subsp. strangulata]|uniref:uncharacterized protein n=1 Tax=Aegilops tauschii subsp. strangulata TaxID=200361 RepID=UPI003CC85C18